METWHIHVGGQVQGVGFRPFVFRLAMDMGLKGWVSNAGDGVHIEVNADEETTRRFLEALSGHAPPLARITRLAISRAGQKLFEDFRIMPSQLAADSNLLLTPDLALCEDCRAETRGGANRRHDYPFTTCNRCGPRYSILRSLPYDRENTAMLPFAMCPACASEYDDPTDRRYFSQTNSCPRCGIRLELTDRHGSKLEGKPADLIEQVVRLWQSGKIVAVKGIGGYLLTCSAGDGDAIARLRERKQRPAKPLALMFPGLAAVREHLQCDARESALLQGPAAPVVLLEKKQEGGSLPAAIAPGLDRLGAMLPCTPLFDLLLDKHGGPVVATSGNTSNAPIVFEDAKALEALAGVADYILANDREIVVPQDDSVVSCSHFKRQTIVIRRSRGMAPTMAAGSPGASSRCVFAAGAMLKSTFALQSRGNIYLSQYLGDLGQYEAQENYGLVARHLLKLLDARPSLVLCDEHPAYPSTLYAEALCRELDVPLQKIQHHLAHFGAILGEHGLVGGHEAVLGVIWDGSGLGSDGQVWGGEFFLYHDRHFRRIAHLDYFDSILGDKMAREPRVSALSACWGLAGAGQHLREKFTGLEWQAYSAMLEKGSQLRTSSLGRLFDAVASLLGVCDRQSYEGEAAMLLEALATRHCKAEGLDFPESYLEGAAGVRDVPVRALMQGVLDDMGGGRARQFIAAKFHFSLVKVIESVAGGAGVRKIAFSGGVFQNGLLVDMAIHRLGSRFELHFHRELPPNDECVSFGQLMAWQGSR